MVIASFQMHTSAFMSLLSVGSVDQDPESAGTLALALCVMPRVVSKQTVSVCLRLSDPLQTNRQRCN